MNYYFRRIKPIDIDSIWSLIDILKAEKSEVSFTRFTSPEQILGFIDNPEQLCYVAVSKEDFPRVLCLIMGKRKLSIERSHSVFLSAATHPVARGLGLAAKLANFSLDQMKNEGVTIARIYVYSKNQASLNAVKKLDFVHAGTVLRHYLDPVTGEYVDDIIFHKILDE